MRDTERDLDERLDEALRQAPALSVELFHGVTGRCTRLSSLRLSGKAVVLDRMTKAGAWTDAAITLIAFELPNWNVRRLVCEDGNGFALCRGTLACQFPSMSLSKGAIECWRSPSCGP